MNELDPVPPADAQYSQLPPTAERPEDPAAAPSRAELPADRSAEPAPASAPLAEVAARLAAVEQAVRELTRRDESARAALDTLHAELGDYKADFLVRAQAPMLRALVRLLDDVDDMIAGEQPVTSRDLAFLADQVVEILESYGAQEIAEEPETVDGAFQKVLRTVPTADPAQHRKVAAVLRRGWRANGRLLRPQSVSAYAFSGQADAPEPAAAAPDPATAFPEPAAAAPEPPAGTPGPTSGAAVAAVGPADEEE